MFLIFLPTGPINTLILETVPVSMRAAAMAASIVAIHALGDLWSPKIVGLLSDRLGSLRVAARTRAPPPALAVCPVCWAWLALRQARRRRRAGTQTDAGLTATSAVLKIPQDVLRPPEPLGREERIDPGDDLLDDAVRAGESPR